MSISLPRVFRRTSVVAATVALCAATVLSSGAAASTSSPARLPAPSSTSTTAAGTGYGMYAGLAYVNGGTSEQVLDLYVPTHTTRPAPLIVYVHGGGWTGTGRSELTAQTGWDTLLSEGFAVATIDYTSSSTAVFPQQIYDVNAAIRYLHSVKGTYRLDGSIGLMGESAGGQLAALAGASCGVGSLQNTEGVTKGSSCVQAVFDGMGPTDFLQMDSHLYSSTSAKHDPASSAESRYLGCTEGLSACFASTVERANPITYITSASKLPSYYIAHGDADNSVPHYESEILFSALTAACADVTFDTMHGQDHFMLLMGALNPPYPAQTVLSSKNCSPVSSTDSVSLTWAGIASYFQGHVR
jgi:acetyl esterase/lipase